MNWWELLLYNASTRAMEAARKLRTGHIPTEESMYDRNEAQNTYLLPSALLKKAFLEAGYIEGEPGDYGLVKKAVGNNNFPIFQTLPDTISRDELAVIGNVEGNIDFDMPNTFYYPISDNAELSHAGSYPSAIYIDHNDNVYRKSWDLNDYGNDNGRAGQLYGLILWAANLLDKIGSPTVVTTGFQPVYRDIENKSILNIKNMYDSKNPIARKFIKDRGLIPYYKLVVDPDSGYTSFKTSMFTLPEIIVTPKGSYQSNKEYIDDSD